MISPGRSSRRIGCTLPPRHPRRRHYEPADRCRIRQPALRLQCHGERLRRLGSTFGLGAGSGPLPPGLALNTATGLISGTATAAGNYQVALTASNPYGMGASVLDIQILPPGSGVTRELWSNLPGPNISDIPFATTPGSIDNQLTTIEDDTAYGNNTGERLRGYFTAPVRAIIISGSRRAMTPNSGFG